MPPRRTFCSLRTRAEFDRVFAGGRRFFRQGLGFYFRLTSDDVFRYGISVPRRFGIAVERNTFRRRVREALRLSDERAPGIEMVICLARKCSDIGYAEIRSTIGWALRRIRRGDASGGSPRVPVKAGDDA